MSQIPLSKISGLPSLETVLSEANLFQAVAPVDRSFGDHLQRANIFKDIKSECLMDSGLRPTVDCARPEKSE